MKTISRISGAVFAISLFWTWGTIGLADMGEWHPVRLMIAFGITFLAGAVWLLSRGDDDE